MTKIYYQGRSWALNLRDSGLAVEVFTRGRRLPGSGRGRGLHGP
jgi:hypothetical protein